MQKILISLTACAALVACGGGSGGGGGDSKVTENSTQNNSLVGAAVSLSASNYESAAKELVGSATQIRTTTDLGGALLLGSQMSSVPPSSAFLQAKLPLVVRAMKRDSLLSGGVFQYSEPCLEGGQINVVESDNNNNNELDAGDSAVLTIENCKENGVTLSGKMSIEVISGSAYSDLTASDISITANIQDFKVAIADIVNVVSGSYTMTISPLNANNLKVEVRAPSLTSSFTQAGKTKVFQYKNYTVVTTANPTTTTWLVNGNVSVPSLGANTADIEMLTPFSTPTNSNIATTGQMLITVKNGGKIRVTANGSTNARVELDLNSDGIYEESKVVPWIDIL